MADKIFSGFADDQSLRFDQPGFVGFRADPISQRPKFLQNPLVRFGIAGSIGIAGYQLHKYKLANSPTYLTKLNNFAARFEDYSPNQIGRTFGFRDRLQAYNAGVKSPVIIPSEHLYTEGGNLTGYGEWLNAQFRGKVKLNPRDNAQLVFNRVSPTDHYLQLAENPEIRVKFADARGQLAGSAYRLHNDLDPKPIRFTDEWKTPSGIAENFKAIKESQRPRLHPIARYYKEPGVGFAAYHVKIGKSEDLLGLAEKEAFYYAERGHKLMYELGLGVRQGTYNRLFHVPGFSGGNKGLVTEIMLKRVAPVVGALTALRWLDYQTGHHASSALINLPLKANVIRAELTDKLPGGRKITDFYKNVVPGPQYGPLALPALGAFTGGLLHYAKVLRGEFTGPEGEILRHETAKLITPFKKIATAENLETAIKLWHETGAPAKGLAFGVAAMLPFLPGMLGSRKSAAELRSIYSGQEDVPIRSGRWWRLGSTPFAGTRITSWRPHWSVLYKSRAKDVSLYGSEKEYWKNNPILHPLRYIRNPYALEEINYKDRPYPITSPAFSNVPLIGPLLAGTIGKIVKPVKLMHEDEWTPDDYNVYSTRLNPKGPVVESKLERDFLQSLASRGYAAQTQVHEGNYRIDFAFEGEDGQKIAVETDGASYHGYWNKAADEKRQADLEKAGWQVIRVGSKSYFNDPDKATDEVASYLHKKGVKNIDVTGLDIRSGLVGLAPPIPKEEYGFKDVIERESEIVSEFVGLPGYIVKTLFHKVKGPSGKGQEVFLQGSRQLDNWSRQYYENQLGEGLGPNPEGGEGLYGYTEPLRRFIQRDPFEPQVNEIPNTMPTWIPGENYLTDFKKGDPFSKIDHGYARLPGKGYAALHPELEGVDPENYPDIYKLSILGDVAPYSREFNIYKDKIGNYLNENKNSALRAQYERVLDQVRQTRESILQSDKRRFTESVDNIEGTVKTVSSKGVELSEYPGRLIKFSSISLSGADISAMIMGRDNVDLATADSRSDRVRAQALSYINEKLAPGTKVEVGVPANSIEHAKSLYGVFKVDGENVNKGLVDEGLAPISRENSTAEYQEMFGMLGKALGFASEELSFTGDEKSLWNAIPTPYHTKLWQERTALSQYISQEVVGTRMRRWDRPFDDFVFPYARGIVKRTTGINIMSEETSKRRELNTLADMLKYIRGLHNRAEGMGPQYTNEIRRTNIGTDLLGSSIFVASTIPDRDKRYFGKFLEESDPDKRVKILKVASPEMAKALQGQWAAQDAAIAQAEGKDTGILESQGRLVTPEGYEDYKKAKTQLGYGDYMRSKEIADFFAKSGLNIPEADSSILWSNNIDYEDVKLKIIENEGYDAHDFNIFDDRSAMLWRKPYIAGAVNELTSGDKTGNSEQIRRSIEDLIMRSTDRNPDVRVISQASNTGKGSVKVNIRKDDSKETQDVIKDMRRNPEDYKSNE